MPAFAYRAALAGGSVEEGRMEAADRRAVVQRLAARGARALAVTPVSEAAAAKARARSAAPANASPRPAEANTLRAPATPAGRARPSRAASRRLGLDFLRKVGELLTSGLPVGDTVRLLAHRSSQPELRDLAGGIWRDLAEGRSLAAAMGGRKGAFSETHLHLVEAGEASGNLALMLDRIVKYEDEAAELRAKIQGSLTYPIVVCVVAFVVVGVFLFQLLPSIRKMLTQMGGELPLATQILVTGADSLVVVGPVALVLAAVTAFVVVGWRKGADGVEATDGLALRLPVLGPILLHAEILRTTTLLATLLESGVNTTEALRLTENTVTNRTRRNAFSAARTQIQEGVSIAGAFKAQNYLPDLAVDILTVGENTGHMGNSLKEIAKLERRELTRRLDGLVAGITTGALAFAFSLVGLIALSIVSAVFSVSQSIQLRK